MRRLRTAVSLTAAALILADALAGQASLEKTDLFEAGTGGYALYRIPGVVATARGSVLAFCEARKSGRSDWGAIDILLRRSADGGRTWTRAARIARVEGPVAKNPAALAQKLATPGETTYNNPVAIAGRHGVVHFLFCAEYMRAFYMRSGDDGASFSRPVEITSALDAFRPEYDWKVLATGPGHGIELRNGRLIVPVWLSAGTGAGAHRPSVASVIYSDDRGRTWRRGDIAIPDTPEFVFPSESQVVELADGRVMMNARTESKTHRRAVTYSQDGATRWSRPEFHEQLVEPVCMASLVRMPGGKAEAHGPLLFSNPDNLARKDGKETPGAGRDRRNLTVRLSRDDGKTWEAKRVLEPGYAGYSDLAAGRDGTIYCLYERGGLGEDYFRTAYLTLARFNLAWLEEGRGAGGSVR